MVNTKVLGVVMTRLLTENAPTVEVVLPREVAVAPMWTIGTLIQDKANRRKGEKRRNRANRWR